MTTEEGKRRAFEIPTATVLGDVVALTAGFPDQGPHIDKTYDSPYLLYS